MNLKRHLHLGDPRSGRWKRRAVLCNSNDLDNDSSTRQSPDKCREEKRKAAAIRDRETDKTMGCLEELGISRNARHEGTLNEGEAAGTSVRDGSPLVLPSGPNLPANTTDKDRSFDKVVLRVDGFTGYVNLIPTSRDFN